ncbi:glycoside hydrolase family 3 protein [Sclerotinia borealis F-4128]|uniref:xylan 1,4-beta-xylosidase n=1 Tax=Sclerotinia borealis (strain F-4128) TaxID=1432307 RepID=W9C7Q6_SCLBF|nr:glycoside hydrolase family 3 protein [Sclerotinia borealis F-4128]
MRTSKLLSAVSIAGAVAQKFPDCVNGPLANNTVCDTTVDPYTRATALVALFTLTEKINNTGNTSPGVSRIGLPPYEWWNEALHGLARGASYGAAGSNYSYSTSFPQPILMGASFDDELIHNVASQISTEARAFSNANRFGLNYWTPNINPYKDPRWGRGQETPGEDPFHVSSYVNALVTGLQGGLDDLPYKKGVATCKHYAGYDLEDGGGAIRYGFDAIISSQDLRDYYLPSFQQCARDSNVQSVMCSYNAVNGIPTCADEWLLQTLLREHWGWEEEDQWVVSDCDAVQNIWDYHHYTSTPEQAAADALNAGTDLDCGTFYPTYLGSAYNQSLYNISTLDRSLIRRYASLVRLGYFDPASIQPYRQLGWSDVSTPTAGQLALQAAEDGIVLLKNDGLLPLSSNITNVALIGPWGNATTQMQGNYYGRASYLNSPLIAAQNAGFKVTYIQGADIDSSNTTQFGAAVAAAQKSDVVIYVGGIDNSIEEEGKDRTTITWPSTQLSLINQLANLSTPLIISQMGCMIDSSTLLSNPGVNAMIWAGYPGQDGGTAILNILTGKSAPAGRLPITQYPSDYVNQVSIADMDLLPGEHNPGRTYKWFNGTPIYEFGFGMHYTTFNASITAPSHNTFAISDLLSKATTYKDLTPFLTLPLTVSNTGTTTSDYTILLFLSGTFGPAPYPKKSLVAYTKIHDIAGDTTANAELKLNLGSLARGAENGDLVLYPGDYRVLVDVDGMDEWGFTLTGEEAVLDSWPERKAVV